MALKNPSANCFRKFKGLQLTFQVVTMTRYRSQISARGPRAGVVWVPGRRRYLVQVWNAWNLLRMDPHVTLKDAARLAWHGKVGQQFPVIL